MRVRVPSFRSVDGAHHRQIFILGGFIINCKYCNREINNIGSLKAHEKVCKENPNAIKYNRSPNAGAKRGSIPWNKGKKTGRGKHWDEKYTDEKVFCENSRIARHSVKSNILRRNLIEYRCSCCGIGPEWNGKPMTLILDHINGVNNDNRLENLRFVCSNCDSQLPTYKARNRKNIGG